MHKKVELIRNKFGMKFYAPPSPTFGGGETSKMIGGGGTSTMDPGMKGNQEEAQHMCMLIHGYGGENRG